MGGFLWDSVSIRYKNHTKIDILIALHLFDDEGCEQNMRKGGLTGFDNIQKSSVLDAITQIEPRRAMDNGAGERRSPMKRQSQILKHGGPCVKRTPIDVCPHAAKCPAPVQWMK